MLVVGDYFVPVSEVSPLEPLAPDPLVQPSDEGQS